MALVWYLLNRRRRQARRNRLNTDRILFYRLNPFNLSDARFIKIYRLSKEATRALISVLFEHMNRDTNGFSVDIQVLASLRLLGSGGFQELIGESAYTFMSQATVSRMFERFTTAMVLLVNDFIKFPTDARSIAKIKREFYAKSGIPNVVGVVDGTHIYIYRPSQTDWHVFVNRHGKYSINVQIICDAGMRILNVVANWPGGTHDSFIWKYSGARQILREMPDENFVLGDSGYPLEPWCITPYLNPVNRHEDIYNERHRSTRSVVERSIGCLKRRFRMLDLSGGILQYTPEKVCRIIMAASILHNICLSFDVPLPDEPDAAVDPPDNDPAQSQIRLRRMGERIRERIALNL